MEQNAWIETYTGIKFFPMQPRAEDICIEDIAHALSLKCRFTGHCREFYSVAQHCVLLSRLVINPEEERRADLEQADEIRGMRLAALMHDATEAYLPDVARPIKPHLKNFKAIEMILEGVIAQRFGLTFPHPRAVMKGDFRLLLSEARDLMPGRGAGWGSGVEPYPDKITGWTPQEAKAMFLTAFYALRNR